MTLASSSLRKFKSSVLTDGSFWVFLLQLVRECKEVLKGGLLMKQYYQFMLREVLDDLQKMDCNIDSFEEDLHKMLMVSFKNEKIWGVLVSVFI